MRIHMASPIEPEICETTGRLLTEWFEFPEYSDEQLRGMALAHYKVDPDEYETGDPMTMDPEQADLQRKINAFVSARKRRKWRHAMSQQEVHHRMNEASKMINTDNFKFLDDETRQRTGLEVNPLWLMECLTRSGILTPKEQLTALSKLAEFTHSKAPSLSLNKHEHQTSEDWLLELAKDEYDVIEEDDPVMQPMQRIENGSGKKFKKKTAARHAETSALMEFGANEFTNMMDNLAGQEWEGFNPEGIPLEQGTGPKKD